MHILHSMTVQANTKKVLATLIKNRESHRKVVKEARAGYLVKARERAKQLLSDLESGKITAVSLGLQMPQDHTHVYDTAIEMLKMHTGKTITLDSTQARNLMMDKWDWKASFLMANSAYSATAAAHAGGINDDE